jgi:hypothetical protein
MTQLWQYTEAQAEAMSAANAAKVLAEQEELEDEGYGEAWDRELEGYALDYSTGSPRKNKHGNYIVLQEGFDVEEAPQLWRHWSKIYSQDEMMHLSVGEALSLHPKVREILEKKVHATIGQFKEHASEATKSKWEKATDAVKNAILGKWLKAKGHPSMDAGRRKTRRSRGRKLRKTRRS